MNYSNVETLLLRDIHGALRLYEHRKLMIDGKKSMKLVDILFSRSRDTLSYYSLPSL